MGFVGGGGRRRVPVEVFAPSPGSGRCWFLQGSLPLERSELVGPPSLHPRKPPPAACHLLPFTPPKVGGIKEGELR